MLNALIVLAAAIALIPPADRVQSQAADPLQALAFLEGQWHGAGKSPYGPYEFDLTNERRGRWLVGTSTIYTPGTDRVSLVATGLIGYDERGLVLYAFDAGGVTIFRGTLEPDGVRFEWKDGRAYRRRTLRRLPDGTISNREESYLPDVSAEPLIFESISVPGKRRPGLTGARPSVTREDVSAASGRPRWDIQYQR